jgi:cytochrome c oxidase subunit 4
MQAVRALRLATPRALPRAQATRALATGTLPQSASDPNIAKPTGDVIPLSNIEAQWESLSAGEQQQVYVQLEEVMKNDWKTVSLDSKKAGMYFPILSYSVRTRAYGCAWFLICFARGV